MLPTTFLERLKLLALMIWARASRPEKFLLGVIPLITIWDLFNANLIDLAVGVVFAWIVWDVENGHGRG
jgi:hypothetical protein